MKNFKGFISEEKIEGGFAYGDTAHPRHKATKAAAYEAHTALQRRGVVIHDKNAFINDMHKLLLKHSNLKDLGS